MSASNEMSIDWKICHALYAKDLNAIRVIVEHSEQSEAQIDLHEQLDDIQLYAVLYATPEIMQYLIQHNVLHDLHDVLWNVASRGNLPLVEILCQHIPDLNDTKNGHCSALIAAHARRRKTIIEYLEQRGARVPDDWAEQCATPRTVVYVSDLLCCYNRECPCCAEPIDAFESSAERQVLSCAHGYHTECLQQWMQYNRSCALCRITIGQGIMIFRKCDVGDRHE